MKYSTTILIASVLFGLCYIENKRIREESSEQVSTKSEIKNETEIHVQLSQNEEAEKPAPFAQISSKQGADRPTIQRTVIIPKLTTTAITGSGDPAFFEPLLAE